jgi:photosystem II stability/assembly factor-like uncharacterized protein
MRKWTSCVLFSALFLFAEKNAPQGNGLDWSIQTSGTTAGLRGVSAVDSQVAWASGSQGTFLRTTDGGKTWVAGSVPGAEKMDFRDIQAFDQDTAFLLSIGRPAKIYKTGDGGKTWEESYSNDAEGIFLDAFAFFDKDNAIVVGDPIEGRFMVLVTSDGGQSWEEIPFAERPEAVSGEGAFAASGTCLTVLGKNDTWFCTGGPAARVFHSRDRGRTWTMARSPLASGKTSSGGFSLVFMNEKEGVMVGGDYQDELAELGNAAVSHDGGKTWELVETRRPSGFRECVAPVPRTRPLMLVAAGPSGSDYSLDLGKTWTAVGGPAGIHSVSFSKVDGSGWAVGRNGLIAKFVYKK